MRCSGGHTGEERSRDRVTQERAGLHARRNQWDQRLQSASCRQSQQEVSMLTITGTNTIDRNC